MVSRIQPEAVVHAVILALGRRKSREGEGKRDEIYKVTYFWDKDKEAGWRWQVFRGRRKRGPTELLEPQFKAQSFRFVMDSYRK